MLEELHDVPTTCACEQACLDRFPACAAYSFISGDVNWSPDDAYHHHGVCSMFATVTKAVKDPRFRGRPLPPVVTGVHIVSLEAGRGPYVGIPKTVRSGDPFEVQLTGEFLPTARKQAMAQTLTLVPRGTPCVAGSPRDLVYGMACAKTCHWQPTKTSKTSVTFRGASILGAVTPTEWDVCYCRGPCRDEVDYYRLAVLTVLPPHVAVVVKGAPVIGKSFDLTLTASSMYSSPRSWQLALGIGGCEPHMKAKVTKDELITLDLQKTTETSATW